MYLGVAIYLTQTISHILTACLNPGIPSRDYYVSNFVRKGISKKNSEYKMCKICNIIIHERRNVSHCEDCNICIEGKFLFIIYYLLFTIYYLLFNIYYLLNF